MKNGFKYGFVLLALYALVEMLLVNHSLQNIVMVVLLVPISFLNLIPFFGSEDSIKKWIPFKKMQDVYINLHLKFKGDYPFLFKQECGGQQIKHFGWGVFIFLVWYVYFLFICLTLYPKIGAVGGAYLSVVCTGLAFCFFRRVMFVVFFNDEDPYGTRKEGGVA